MPCGEFVQQTPSVGSGEPLDTSVGEQHVHPALGTALPRMIGGVEGDHDGGWRSCKPFPEHFGTSVYVGGVPARKKSGRLLGCRSSGYGDVGVGRAGEFVRVDLARGHKSGKIVGVRPGIGIALGRECLPETA